MWYGFEFIYGKPRENNLNMMPFFLIAHHAHVNAIPKKYVTKKIAFEDVMSVTYVLK